MQALFPGRPGLETLVRALPLFLALLLVGVGVPGRWLGSVETTFWISSLACLGLSSVLLFRWRLSLAVFWPKFHRADLSWVLVSAVAIVLVGIVSLRYAIFDEVRLQGHIPVVEAMLRGHFPPTYIAFPDVGFRYHYGFNILAALCGMAVHVPGYLGIDIATLVCWVAFVSNLFLLFSSLGIHRKGWALAFCFVVLSGGMSWLLVPHHDGGSGPIYQLPYWQQMFIYFRVIHPSFIMYFFQHPISLGLVLFLGMLKCFTAWSEEGNRKAYWTGVFLLGAMSLAQVMLFATSLAALGIVFFWRFFRAEIPRSRNLLEGMGVLVGALLLAFALGGFFQWTPGAESQPIRFTWPPGYLRNEFYGGARPITWRQTIIWYLSGFGLVLFMIPWAWWKAVRSSWRFVIIFLLAFGVLSALIPHFFQYSYSWDIVKWFFAFEFSGRILIAWALWPWLAQSASRR
ncbi:MAG: hypothetical protein K8R69_09085, partial [Deltaproteobacteria bacterium]|nr:hypothetical protein [Deltaproteobacteria bacterium]